MGSTKIVCASSALMAMRALQTRQMMLVCLVTSLMTWPRHGVPAVSVIGLFRMKSD